MFEGPGPLPIIQLPDGSWVEKDPEVYAREQAKYMASLVPSKTYLVPVVIFAILALSILATYAIWG